MYKVEVLERGPTVVFTKKFNIPKADYVVDENTLVQHIHSLNIPWYAKDAMIAQLYYTLHQWYPNHFYLVTYETS